MNWFRENRFLGAFLVTFGISVLGSSLFLFRAKSDWDETSARFKRAAAELNRLERLAPYPSSENLRKMKAQAENYRSAVAKLEEELKGCAARIMPQPPSEFQSRLRMAMTAITDKAHTNNVRLPDKFYLGFDEFASSLPNEAAAPLLGQELTQIEWLLNCLLDAPVEALTAFHRTPLPEEHGVWATSPNSALAPGTKSTGSVRSDGKSLERNVVEATFFSTPSAARKVLNQIAGTNQPFCIIRLLHVRNEKDKGPPREPAIDMSAGVRATHPGSSATKPSVAPALNFIVGNERIETTAKIEIVRFAF